MLCRVPQAPADVKELSKTSCHLRLSSAQREGGGGHILLWGPALKNSDHELKNGLQRVLSEALQMKNEGSHDL